MTNGHENRDSEPGPSFDDPEFETLPVTLGVDGVVERITDTVKGLHTTSTDVGTKVRTTDGMLVAVVRDARNDDAGSVLQYRTEPASKLSTRKAGKLAAALEAYGSDAETEDGD